MKRTYQEIIMLDINQVMKQYQRAFDMSIKQRNIVNAFRSDSENFKKLNDRLIDYEQRCVRLDEKLLKLYQEFLKQQFA